MHALHELVQQGLVRYIGMSSCYAWECEPRLSRYLAVYSLMKLSLAVHYMQSAWTGDPSSSRVLTTGPSRLCDHARLDAVHFHARPPQPDIPRGRARDVPHFEGECSRALRKEAARIAFRSTSAFLPFLGRLLAAVCSADHTKT